MSNPLARQPHDRAVLHLAPASRFDRKVPTAEEISLSYQMLADLSTQGVETGWRSRPSLTFPGSPPRRLNISAGEAVFSMFPDGIYISTGVTLPQAGIGSINRKDYLYLVCFVAEVGALQDPVLGQMVYQARNRNTNEIEQVLGENTRRLRAFWSVLWSSTAVTPQQLNAALPLSQTGSPTLSIVDTTEAGFALGQMQFYARDAHLGEHDYKIFTEFTELLEIARIKRLQDHTNRGYTWGANGESNLDAMFHIEPAGKMVESPDPETIVRARTRELMSGIPGPGASYNRAVQNLSSSSVGDNPGLPGEATGSPNGTAAIGNGQRITFTNQSIIDTLGCFITTATATGSGNPIVNISLNGAPLGSFFSGNRADHKIYGANGVEQSERGQFSGLGTTGLVWIGDANSSIVPGQTVYIQAGVFYPAGSGFSIPFSKAERAWLGPNPQAISPGNLLDAATQDLEEYTNPVNGENYWLVFGRERASLQYIYRKVSITTNSAGLAVIPPESNGVFAFIQGVQGRIDSPVRAGLPANTTFNALVYDAPRPSQVWQIQFAYPEYQGIGNSAAAWLDGATIASPVLFWITTQGGGLGVHQGEGETQFSPVSMHLPSVNNPPIPPYRFNGPCQLIGEPYQGPITLREVAPLPAPGLVIPSPGQCLTLLPAEDNQSRSIKGKLATKDGRRLGFRTPQLANQAEYQAIMSFLLHKDGDRHLMVVTRNTSGRENVALDSDTGTAFDLFNV